MNFKNLSAPRIGDNDVVVTPMLCSMIFNKGKSSFSTNSSMQLFLYEVFCASEDTAMQAQLMSQVPLTFNTVVLKDSEDLTLQSVNLFTGSTEDNESKASMESKDINANVCLVTFGKRN